MALIYTLKFPPNLLDAAEQTTGYDRDSLTGNYITNRVSDLGTISQSLNNVRTPLFPTEIVLPREDIATPDLKVSTRLEENKSKITYEFGLIGSTAREIINYLRYIRLPAGTDAYPEPIEDLEYLFNIDKHLILEVRDNCCPVITDGRARDKLVLKGYIPLNTIRYCENGACSVDCTIYEDTKRTQAIKCIENTVLGVKSNVGKLVTAEYSTDKSFVARGGVNTMSFGTVAAKWFDVCVEPQNPTGAAILMGFIGAIKALVLIPLTAIILAIDLIIIVINTIISAINVIPGINVDKIDTIGIDGGFDAFDEFFGIEIMAEGLFGCKYVRGGYYASSIIKTICSECGFSVQQFRDATEINTFNDDFTAVKTPVSLNPYTAFGNASGGIAERFISTGEDTVYVPAEEAFTRREESKILDNLANADQDQKTSIKRNVAIRATSIETTDKILSRLGSLWGTGWDVVSCPVSEDTPNGIQLQVGPLEGRYAFSRSDIVDVNVDNSELAINDADVCYTIGDNVPIGYSTTWTQDSSDQVGNSQIKAYNGYVSFRNLDLEQQKPKNIADYPVDFAPVQHIGSVKQNTYYDDAPSFIGFPDFEDFFEEGQMVNSSPFITVPKLVTITDGSARVLQSGVAARVKRKNYSYFGSYRISDTVFSAVIGKEQLYDVGSQNVFDYSNTLGIQNHVNYHTVGYGPSGITSTSLTFDDIEFLVQDYVQKFGSEAVGEGFARNAIISGTTPFAYLGPFTNMPSGREVITDSTTYNFAPLMEFTLEKENYTCEEEELINQCLTEAVLKVTNPNQHDINNPSYKLRLLRLTQGLGVVTSTEIDYENRKISAEGYVIPFFQVGVDYRRT